MALSTIRMCVFGEKSIDFVELHGLIGALPDKRPSGNNGSRTTIISQSAK
jgi:hypothetical protein